MWVQIPPPAPRRLRSPFPLRGRRGQQMTMAELTLFDDKKHRSQVVQLWRQVFGHETAHNDPDLVIDNTTAAGDGLFWVAVIGERVLGTIMAGYDGHRGWIYSLAVHPDHRKQGIGSRLLAHAEERVISLGCLKINLQIVKGNEQVQAFYEANGYSVEPRISMGKRLSKDLPTP